MYRTPVRLRSAAFQAQQGQCFYCQCEMWQDDPAPLMLKLGMSRKAAKLFKCTAEHLLARQDGGRNEPDNVVAACAYCNRSRHRAKMPLSPADFARRVKSRLQSHRWHSRAFCQGNQA